MTGRMRKIVSRPGKKIAMAAALAALACASARADIVFTNGGAEISGAVVRIDSAAVVLSADGRETSYPLSQVLKVKLVHVFGVPGEKTAADITDPALKAVLKSPATPADYPDDGSVIYLDDKSCDIGKDGRAACTRHVIQLVLRERDKETAANEQFDYLDKIQTASIDWARSVNGDAISNLDDTSVEEGSENSQYPDYDRLKSLKFAVPDVATGTVVDYQYRVQSPVSVATQPFTAAMQFRFFEPVVLARFTVTAPKGMALDVVARGLPKDAIIKTEQIGSRVRRIWEVRNQPSFKRENGMPPYSRIAPFVEAAPKKTWAQVAADAAAAIGPELAPGPDVSAQTAEIIKGKTTDAAKAEALYNWVAQTIDYEPVTMSDYGYAPKSPAQIFSSKVGNALDKPFLLFVMLRQAGFKPQLAYLNDKNDLPFEKSLPSLGQFDAAAVLLDIGGRRLTLIPHEDNRRWQETPPQLQGVHGLVVFGPDQGKIIENPLAPAARESEAERMTLALSADGTLKGSETILPLGQAQAFWRAMKDWKKQDVEHAFQQIVYGIHPGARLLGYSIDGLDDPTRDLAVHVSFAARNYALTASGGYMAFRMPWTAASAEDVGRPSREEPMFWWHRSDDKKTISVSLPKGWKLYYAPPPAKLAGPGTSYQASYAPRPGAGVLTYSSTSTRRAVEISPEQYPGYKAFREAVANYAEKWIVLKKG
ncbi:MAG TPA: DUF3857 and transglutaminase domain-containing protein [Elusimicrobiota bacterium]|nr:DUF3857 and transglutaminase domain-containing protein [Elusimicrobiota bacterium]